MYKDHIDDSALSSVEMSRLTRDRTAEPVSRDQLPNLSRETKFFITYIYMHTYNQVSHIDNLCFDNPPSSLLLEIFSGHFFYDFGRGVAHQTVFSVACNSDSEIMMAGSAPNSGSEAVCTSYAKITTSSTMLMARVSYRCFGLVTP